MTADELGCAWREAMLDGGFESAWRASDRIRSMGVPDPHRFWQGEEFSGKRVMLRCLHGFGDAVQFLRYVPMLRARAASVCVEVAPRFVQLAHCLQGVDEVVTWGEGAPAVAPQYDVQIEVMELPYIFRTHLADLPIATQYLHVQPLARPNDETLQVGLAWTAGEWNATRAVPPELLQPLLSTKDCHFWNLTTGPAPSCLKPHLHEDEICRNSVRGLAARIAALDLVITVDTLAAHLAGAMGVPAWVLLQAEADWRWLRSGEASPWYPSLKLFRQQGGTAWNVTIEKVRKALLGLRSEEQSCRI